MINFKKIATIVGSALMIGSTVAMAAAANYPSPFSNGAAIVVGSGAANSDWVAAANIRDKMPATGSTTTTGASAVGGDSVNLATGSQLLYMNSGLNISRNILTKDHMPTLLADGTAYDSSGVAYTYTQTIALTGGTSGERKITFGKSGESIDPALYIDIGYSATNPFYNYTLTFGKSINVSDSTIIGTATLNMLGKSYTVGANSDYNTLYLYGSGVTATVNEGETVKKTVGDVEHTVLLVGASSTTQATIEVDGVRKTVTKGSSYRFVGDFEVYIKDLYYASKTGTLSSVDLLLGAKTLHFESGQAVRYGADDTTILGTNVIITPQSGQTGGGVNGITISQGAESATGDYVKIGGVYTDRVIGGLQVTLADAVPALDSSARDKIKIDTDNSVAAQVTFTSALAGTTGEKTIAYARDRDLVADSDVVAELKNPANNSIINFEGKPAKVGDWYVVNDNDEGRVLEVISIGPGASANDKTTFRDVITGETLDFSTGLTNRTVSARAIGGASYYIQNDVNNTDSAQWNVSITWGSGATPNVAGSSTTIYPRIKLKNGEWLSFLNEQTVNNASTVYSLPGLYLYSAYKAGAAITDWSVNHNDSKLSSGEGYTKVGNINYSLDIASTNLTANIAGIETGTGGVLTTSDCVFNATFGPAILLQEEKTQADSNGYYVCVPLTTVGSTTVMPAIGIPVTSDSSLSLQTLTTDTYTSQGVTTYGTLVSRNVVSGTNYAATLSYPDNQMFVDVLFKAEAATVTGGGVVTTAGTGYATVEDSEVSSVSSKNLIVIGGSCINAVAAKLLGKDTPACEADFTTLAGVADGEALIKSFTSPYASDKVALLVAGYNAADTTKAAQYLTSNVVDTTVGKGYKVTSATEATAITTTTA